MDGKNCPITSRSATKGRAPCWIVMLATTFAALTPRVSFARDRGEPHLSECDRRLRRIS